MLSSRKAVTPREMSFGIKIVPFMRNDLEHCAVKNVMVADCYGLLFKLA